jgi:hypothetical protein
LRQIGQRQLGTDASAFNDIAYRLDQYRYATIVCSIRQVKATPRLDARYMIVMLSRKPLHLCPYPSYKAIESGSRRLSPIAEQTEGFLR